MWRLHAAVAWQNTASTTLFLDSYRLTAVANFNGTFASLSKLQLLNLAANLVQVVEDGAFDFAHTDLAASESAPNSPMESPDSSATLTRSAMQEHRTQGPSERHGALALTALHAGVRDHCGRCRPE